MKIFSLPDDEIKSKDSDTLQKFLLDRVIKMRKLNREMKNDVTVQKAEDALNIAKAPYKKIRSKWAGEIEAVELELKSRNIKFNIQWDDIFSDNENND